MIREGDGTRTKTILIADLRDNLEGRPWDCPETPSKIPRDHWVRDDT